jgi:hypothetical protein
LVLIIVSAAVITAGIFGVLHFMENQDSAAPSAAKDETAVVVPPRPSAMPVAPEKPAPEPRERRSAAPSAKEPEGIDDETRLAAPARTTRAKPKAESSMTRMVTNPPGVFLVVDGSSQYSCTTPCSMQLAPGRHTLVATREGYRRTLKIFETPVTDDVFLNLDRTTGTLMVRSEPRGAAIVIDGQTRSEKTPAMLTLPTGNHNVEVQQANRKVTQDVVIRDSGITNLTVDLQER